MKRMGVRDSGAQSGGAMLSGAAQGEARLLVVEDDPNILELLSASLRFAGFSVATATNGARAVLRRTSGQPGPSRLTFADLELDEEAHEVWRDGSRVSLSPTEFKLLRYLMANAGRVLSKGQILDHVWSYDFRGDDSIVESYISYLRRKVDSVEPRLIHTLRGVGYVLRMPS